MHHCTTFPVSAGRCRRQWDHDMLISRELGTLSAHSRGKCRERGSKHLLLGLVTLSTNITKRRETVERTSTTFEQLSGVYLENNFLDLDFHKITLWGLFGQGLCKADPLSALSTTFWRGLSCNHFKSELFFFLLLCLCCFMSIRNLIGGKKKNIQETA